MMKPIHTGLWQAYLFDLDGTLVETAPEIADAVNDTLAHFQWPQVSQAQVCKWIGHGTSTLLVRAIARALNQSSDEVLGSRALQEALPIFDQHYQARCGTRSHLYPQVKEVLRTLRLRGSKLAVVTNKEGRYTDTVLAVHGLHDLVDLVISGDTFPAKKPDPVGVHHCLKQWALQPHQAVFVGDSSIDAATARKAGMAVYLLPYGYNMGEPIEACQPDRVIADFSALL